MRKINNKILLLNTLLYRISVIILHTIILFIISGVLSKAIIGSLYLNTITTFWYFIYNLVFYKKFKIGK